MKKTLVIVFFTILLISCSSLYSPYNKMFGNEIIFDVKYLDTEINKINTTLLKENSVVYSDYGFVVLSYLDKTSFDDLPYKEVLFNAKKNYSKKDVPFSKYGIQFSRFPFIKSISAAIDASKRDFTMVNFNKNVLAAKNFWDEKNQKINISN